MLRLHAFFHLNLMFSSIEEESRPAVIERCYWPILNLAEKLGRPLGIEATGYTLEEIERIDPAWTQKCRALIERGLIEPIGSGYAQIIAPLFPSELTRWNLKLGHKVYEHMFGRRPRVALINEQAYSAGILPLYAEAGYEAILMDWDMCAYAHPEWHDEWRYHTQIAQGQNAELPVIWTNTVAFQKLQRLAHGDIELDEYVDYIASRRAAPSRTLALYSNDAEIFNFRPGRYKTEAAAAGKRDEWEAVEEAFRKLIERTDIEWISTAQAMEPRGSPDEMHRLKLESAAFPIPVKKQMKYNVSRWAVTGRADFEINGRCRALVKRLSETQSGNVAHWRRLCWLASSDFRTHITQKRFANMLFELDRLDANIPAPGPAQSRANRPAGAPIRIERSARKLTIESDLISLTLNPRKGLAIDRLQFAQHGSALIGTISHGAYDDVVHAFDWFSGTMISEFVGHPKWTDLAATEPRISTDPETGKVTLRAPFPMADCDAIKLIEITRDEPKIAVRYILPINAAAGTLRIGNITLLPEALDAATLYFETHNGGAMPERFALAGQTVDHGAPISFLVSASSGVGMTEGAIVIGDARSAIRVSATTDSNAFLGLITHRMVKGKVFCRVSLSASELDETRKPWPGTQPLSLGYTISPA